jgi:hypothetical protein
MAANAAPSTVIAGKPSLVNRMSSGACYQSCLVQGERNVCRTISLSSSDRLDLLPAECDERLFKIEFRDGVNRVDEIVRLNSIDAACAWNLSSGHAGVRPGRLPSVGARKSISPATESQDTAPSVGGTYCEWQGTQ